MNRVKQVRVLYNDRQKQWVIAGYGGVSLRWGRELFDTKQRALQKARKLAKKHNAALMVETKSGVGSKEADYRESEPRNRGGIWGGRF